MSERKYKVLARDLKKIKKELKASKSNRKRKRADSESSESSCSESEWSTNLHGSASYGCKGPGNDSDSDNGDDVISNDVSGTRHRPSLFVENELKNNKNNDRINRSIKSSIY